MLNHVREERRAVVKFYGVLQEIAGSLGDLGTFLPHVISSINVARLNPVGIFSAFGLFYIFTGLYYRIPVPVQPMKAASAAILVQELTPGEIAGAAVSVGVILFIFAATGLIEYINKLIPKAVVAGVQLGLGLGLAGLGLKLISEDILLGLLNLCLILFLLNNKKAPAAVISLFFSVGFNLLFGGVDFPQLKFSFNLPNIYWPTLNELQRGFIAAAVPQIPLTLTNAIILTTAVGKELYPERSSKLTARNLAFTHSIGNLVAGPLGGYLMCHGSGGMVAHYRFGARTWLAPLFIGTVLLSFGLFLGESGLSLLALIPEAALGGLLFYSGLDLAVSSKSALHQGDYYIALLTAAIACTANAALGLAAGIIVYYLAT